MVTIGKRWARRALVPAALLIAAGCSSPPHRTGGEPPTALPIVPRIPIEDQLREVPAVRPVVAEASAAAPADGYRQLDAFTTQCRAVRYSALGNLLDRERTADSARLSVRQICPSTAKKDELRDAVLGYASLEARNQTSGLALTGFYKLAEAEAGGDLYRETQTVLTEAVRRVEEARASGARIPAESEEFRRQQLKTNGDLVLLRVTQLELNRQLVEALCLEPIERAGLLWPAADFAIDPEPLDVDRAVAVGLAYRAELNLLRRLGTDLDDATVAVVRDVLKSVNPLLGGGPGTDLVRRLLLPLEPLFRGTGSKETEARRRQIAARLADRERAVADEIRQDAQEMEAQAQLAAIAKQKVAEAKTRYDEWARKKEAGERSFPDLQKAHLDWLTARSELMRAVIGWHVARVKLQTAQGVLPFDCGGPTAPGCR